MEMDKGRVLRVGGIESVCVMFSRCGKDAKMKCDR